MNYIDTPVSFINTESGLILSRSIEERISMLDKLVELIVFTPRGSFGSDLDFGFEYWNHEYTNVQYREFNNDQTGASAEGFFDEITKKECQESIRQSLAMYAPQLKHVYVSMKLNTANTERQEKKTVFSKYKVTVEVNGVIEDGLGTTCNYFKPVEFFIEPTAKRNK